MIVEFLQTSSLFKVLTLEDKELWNDYLRKSCAYDFYQTWDYHVLDKQGQVFMFVYEKNDLFIGIPLVKRTIAETGYYDCTCVYGYAGPVSNIDFSLLSTSFIREFHEVFRNYLLSEKIVTLFTILNPLFNQEPLFPTSSFDLKVVGKTIAIDLRQPLEQQRLQYRRQIRMKVNQLRKKGFTVKKADTRSELNDFIDIYFENMLKVGANSKYFFEHTYFEKFMASEGFSPMLIGAYYEGRMIAGAMVGMTGNIMQLHLAGTRNEFLRESPMKLIFDEATLIGRLHNMHYLHLGSGVSGKEDSLFHFKQGFSENLYDFTVWRYVVDEPVYTDIVKEMSKEKTAPDTDLFPLYRFM